MAPVEVLGWVRGGAGAPTGSGRVCLSAGAGRRGRRGQRVMLAPHVGVDGRNRPVSRICVFGGVVTRRQRVL